MNYSEEEKTMWLEDWRHSGKSAWAYAKANGLNPQTFVRWTKARVAKASAEPNPCFVEVAVPAAMPPVGNTAQILIEKGEVKIHIPLSVGCNELRAMMEGLGRVL